MKQKNLTLLHKLKELAAEAYHDEKILSDLTPQDDSDKSEESRDHIITNSTVIPVLFYQTGYTRPMIVNSLAKQSWKQDRYNKETSVAIGKRGSGNDVVCITLQSRQFKWKKGKNSKSEGRWDR